MIKFRENSTVAKYSGELNEFNAVVQGQDIVIDFNNVYDNSIIQVSLGGLVMTEDNDFFILEEKIKLVQRDLTYLNDNVTIMVFKQSDNSGGL